VDDTDHLETASIDRLRTLSLGRFRVFDIERDTLTFADRLSRSSRTVARSRLKCTDVDRCAVELMRMGFLEAALPAALRPVSDTASRPADVMFWQFPARTEAVAAQLHAALPEVALVDGWIDLYLGLPWATWIDVSARRDETLTDIQKELAMQRVRIGGYRAVLRACGVELRVHTVCQHIDWRRLVVHWRDIGITDLWLSHAAGARPGSGDSTFTIHPWHLYAVNVEDPTRRAGLDVGRDPAGKSLLASFVGAHADHYVSDTRLRLLSLDGIPGFHVEVNRRWHLEDVVYRHQVQGRPLADCHRVDESVTRYNEVLSDSVFSLCPAGAGANTLRLWESLAVGSVPVILGPPPLMPAGGTLAPIDWDAIVLTVADDQIPELPRILRSIPLEEVRRRQRLGMEAYAKVRVQRCF
jgi:hypothetical protein